MLSGSFIILYVANTALILVDYKDVQILSRASLHWENQIHNASEPTLHGYENIMTSSNGNNFHVTGHLCREFTGHRWIPHKGQWRGGLMFSLICAWINGWVNNHEADDLRCHRAHYDISVMNCRLHNFLPANDVSGNLGLNNPSMHHGMRMTVIWQQANGWIVHMNPQRMGTKTTTKQNIP